MKSQLLSKQKTLSMHKKKFNRRIAKLLIMLDNNNTNNLNTTQKNKTN